MNVVDADDDDDDDDDDVNILLIVSGVAMVSTWPPNLGHSGSWNLHKFDEFLL